MISWLAAEYAQTPRNRGPLANWTHFGQAGVPGEGAFVQIWLKIEGQGSVGSTGGAGSTAGPGRTGQDRGSAGTIREASYETHGCMWSMACGSVLTQLATGRTVDRALLIEASDIDLVLGGIPDGKGEYADMAVCALRRALREEV